MWGWVTLKQEYRPPHLAPVEIIRVIIQGYCEKGLMLKPTLEKLSVLLKVCWESQFPPWFVGYLLEDGGFLFGGAVFLWNHTLGIICSDYRALPIRRSDLIL